MIYMVSFLSTMLCLKIFSRQIFDFKIGIKGMKKHEIEFLGIKFLLVMGFPFFLGAVRYETGTDYNSYLGFFRLMAISSVDQTSYTGMEYIFRCITKVLTFISENPVVFFGFFSFCTMYIVFSVGIKRKDELSLLYWNLFYLCVMYGMSYNIIRQALAISISTYALLFFLDNCMWKYMLTVLFAALFHSSALVMIPCYFVKFIDKGNIKKLLKLIFVIAVIIVIFNYKSVISLLNMYTSYLLNGDKKHYSAILYLVEKIILSAPIFVNQKRIDAKYKILFYIIFIDLMLCIPMFRIEYFYRITYYFLPVYGILIAHFMKKSEGKGIYKVYYLAVFFAYFYLQYIYLGNHGISIYKSCLREGYKWMNWFQ